jgi:hypothetical protein
MLQEYNLIMKHIKSKDNSHIHYLCIASPLLKKRFGYNFLKEISISIHHNIIFTFNMFHNQIVFLQH